MYKNGESALERVLALVEKCPKELQGSCFEILLSGYVQMEVGPKTVAAHKEIENQNSSPSLLSTNCSTETDIPPSILPRFKNAAKRISVSLDSLEALFDFSVDPFALHAVSVPGKNSSEKTRNIALLAAARSYLASGSWVADRQEVKALCVDHNCYDQANFASILKKGEGDLFKNVEPSKPVELSTGGIKDAERLIKILAEGSGA